MLFLNRAQESFTTTGTGTLTLGGAPAGWRTIAASLLADYALSGTVTKVAYYCVNSDESIWEFGYGTVDTAAGTITRTLIDSSTGALISWAAGTKYLFSTPEAIQFTNHLTHFRGSTAPVHARAGYTWADTTAGVTDVRFKYYDGADWLSLLSIDETNNRVYPLDHAGARIHGPEVDVASAATCDIGAVTSDNVRITGSTGPITSLGNGAAGLRRTVRFASTPTLTHHATNLILPGGTNIAAAAGDRAIMKSQGSGAWECVAYVKADGTALVAPAAATLPQLDVGGLVPSNNAGTPNTKLDVSVGKGIDDTGAVWITNAATKTIDCGTTGANALDAGALANSTWYYAYIISKADGTTAALASTSASAPTLPSGYTYKRRIGQFRTNGSAQIIAYKTVETAGGGIYYEWNAFVRDVNAASLSTTRTSYTLTVPPLKVRSHILAGAVSAQYLVTCPDVSDQAPVGANYFVNASYAYASAAIGVIDMWVLTNASGQISARGEAAGTFNVWTLGWEDFRRT